MTINARLRRFLAEGFFAAQVPPCFSSASLAKEALRLGKQWDLINSFRCSEETAFEPFSVARVGHNRRPIAIPNPVAQFYLSRGIAKDWRQISALIQKSKISLSKPRLSTQPGRAIQITAIKQLQEHRLLKSAGKRFTLVSDVAQFFPNIYTHAIAWAVEGKANAKANSMRNNINFLGPRLDILCRNTQQNQTKGIPIGPDTSHVISELIGVAVDAELKRILNGWPEGYRHVDDFCFFFDTESEATRALTALSAALARYELTINIQKTRITRTAEIRNDSWVHQFDTFRFSQIRNVQRRDLHRFFDLSFSLARQFDDENVMQYALRRIETEIVKTDNWDVFAAYLMRCMDSYPNTIPECVAIVDTYHRYLRPASFPKANWQKFISSQLVHYAPLETHSEVAWLLWLALRMSVKVSREAVTCIEQLQSSVCLLLALALEEQSLLMRGISRSALPIRFAPENLFGQFWLLMYEGAVNGWLIDAIPHVVNDQYFGEMFKKKISFLDFNRIPTAIFTLKEGKIKLGADIADLLDTDNDLYDQFDFHDMNMDYLGRRGRFAEEYEEEEDDNDEIPFDESQPVIF